MKQNRFNEKCSTTRLARRPNWLAQIASWGGSRRSLKFREAHWLAQLVFTRLTGHWTKLTVEADLTTRGVQKSTCQAPSSQSPWIRPRKPLQSPPLRDSSSAPASTPARAAWPSPPSPTPEPALPLSPSPTSPSPRGLARCCGSPPSTS